MDTASIFRKGLAEALDRFLTLRLLRMCIVEGHIDICVTNNTLHRFRINAHCYHLRNIGMSTAMRCQNANAFNSFKSFLELVAEIRRCTGHIRFSNLPNKLLIRISQISGAVSYELRNWDRPITIIGLGRSDINSALYPYHSLRDIDGGTVRRDMPRL